MSAGVHSFKHLFTPFKMGSVEIKNRFVFLPHWPSFSRDGLPTETTMRYYAERAKGGAGLVIIESQAAHPKGQMTPGFILAYDKKSVPHLKKLTDMVHENGAKVFGQLTHQGHTTLMKPPQLLYAPTQMPEPYSRYNTKEMELEDIKEIVDYFAVAAANQRESGFDGIELKVAHDGLLRSFVSPFFNQRNDEYGGSYENRFRLIYEMIAAIRKEVGKDFPVGVRLCLDEFTPWGYSVDYGIKLAKTFEEAGITYINTDSGTFSSFYMEIPPMAIPLGFSIYMSAELKKAVKIPVIAFGRINDPVQAETILAEGCADMIGMCRQLVCDPETPQKAYEGRLDDIRHCIACNDGCIYQVMRENPLHCIQNPGAGREKEFGIGTIKPADEQKSILIIGGGISGMKAAEIAAIKGHKIKLYEKSDRLGGQINLAEKLPYRAEVAEVSRYLRLQLERYKVEVVLNKEAGIEDINAENPDIVIVATGSYPYIPEIEGAEGSNIKIMDVRQALRNPETIGKRVVVLDKDGHWQGGGICEYLLALESETYAITPNSQIGIDLEPSNSHMLYMRLYENGAEIIPLHELYSLDKNDVVIENVFNHQKQIISNVDTLIYAGMSKSDNQMYTKLKKLRPNVFAVGDCVAPRLIEQVIFESEQLCREI
ncbi:MAG: oxidoreductase [Clostridia bacterium]